MAMLAERKSKQKWSSDPRNTTWTNDTSRFGYQMLTKMGWKSGKGLGANEDGTTTNIKSGKRRENLGLGADKSSEDNWLSHQMAFDDLLSQLNSAKGCNLEGRPKENKKHEMEKMARQSRKRVFYNRFIQSKDLSSKSKEDMACIFGQRSKSAPGTPQEQSEGEETDDSTTSCPPQVFHGVQTINSGQSIQEYFEKKMKELKAAKEGKKIDSESKNDPTVVEFQLNSNKAGESVDREKCQEQEEVKQSESRKNKKAQRRKRKLALETCEFNNSDNGADDIELCLVKKKKREKKRKGELKPGDNLMRAASVCETRETIGTQENTTKRKREKKNCSDAESCKVAETKSKKKDLERDEEKSSEKLLSRSMRSSCNSEEIRRKKKKTRKEKCNFRTESGSKVKPKEDSGKQVLCGGSLGLTEASKSYRQKEKEGKSKVNNNPVTISEKGEAVNRKVYDNAQFTAGLCTEAERSESWNWKKERKRKEKRIEKKNKKVKSKDKE